MNTYDVGLDVHKASICIAVLNAAGKSVMESVVETNASTILDCLKGLRGQVEVTFEEGTHAAWLYDTLKQTTATFIVCDPRKNRLLQDGTKSDKVDARKLAQLLRAGLLSPVYHGEHGTRDYDVAGEQVRRTRKAATRGLTQSHHRTRKDVFKSAALTASRCRPFKAWYAELVESGLRPELARVTIARRLAAITLAVWKSGEVFKAEKLIRPAAGAG